MDGGAITGSLFLTQIPSLLQDRGIDPVSSVAAVFVLAAAISLGLGEGACIMSAIALIGQNAPAKTRGSVIGTFAACGATGMLIASGIGGFLFDRWMYTGPFLFMGTINAGIFFFGIYVKLKRPITSNIDHR